MNASIYNGLVYMQELSVKGATVITIQSCQFLLWIFTK